MLTRSGLLYEEELIEALKEYLHLYRMAEKEVCAIPFRDLDKGKVCQGVFNWLGDQWVLTEIK